MSNDSSATIVSKVWNYAHVLKNAGVGYGPASRGIEQITYLLLGPTFGLRADAQPCGFPVSSRYLGARLFKLADEMTELGCKVAAAFRRSLSDLIQRRDASATLFPSWLTN